MVSAATLGPGRLQETAVLSAGGGCARGGRCLGPSRWVHLEGKGEGTVSGLGAKEGVRM